jgi:hypothetical protein
MWELPMWGGPPRPSSRAQRGARVERHSCPLLLTLMSTVDSNVEERRFRAA